MVLLRAVAGVTRADAAGRSGVLVEAAALRPVDLVDALDAAGITVTDFRGATFEDTYLELFRGRRRSVRRASPPRALIPIEWTKQFRRPRTYATLGIVAGFSLVLTVALAATGSGQVEFVGDVPLVMVPRTSGLSVPSSPSPAP